MKFFWWRREQHEQELEEEVRSHLEMARRDRVERGETAEEAEHSARREFGNVGLVKETTRDVWGWRWVKDLVEDARYGLRVLSKNPGFTAVVVLILALGVGFNTAMFSLVNAVLFRPLAGVEQPEQLVEFVRVQPNYRFTNWSYPDYLDYRDSNHTLSGVAARARTSISLANGSTERARGEMVSGNYFSLLGTRPALGRLILPSDDSAIGAHSVAVLNYNLWQRDFGSDPNVVGKGIILNGLPFTVVGVAAKEFAGTTVGGISDLWVPIAAQPQIAPRLSAGTLQERAAGWIALVGRLKPGVSLQQAQADMSNISAQLAQAYPTNVGRMVALSPRAGIDPDDEAELRSFLVLLLGAVILLLLVACSNVANLLLVRAASRRREIAVRLALGASRGRLIRQLLTEGLLLSVMAGAVGLAITPWIGDLTVAFRNNSYLMRGIDLSPDSRVLAFSFLLAIVTGMLFGLAPALQASKPDLVSSLKEGSAAAGYRRSRLQRLLVTAQVALSLVLLIGAGLVLRTMQKILSVDPGFTADKALLASIDLSIQGYSESQGRLFYRQLLERVEAIPSVTSASFAGSLPPQDWEGSSRMSIFYPGQEPLEELQHGREFELGVRVGVNSIAPRYFETLGISLVAGRDFTVHDDDRSPGVVIVNQKLAAHLWPGQNPIAKLIVCPKWPYRQAGPLYQVIGVTRNAKLSLTADTPLLMYFPVLHDYNGRGTLIVRTAGDPNTLASAVRTQVAALDKNLPVYDVQTMREHVTGSLWRERMAVELISIFGVLALVLAAIGLYGVVAHSVTQRTHEIGIRVALGAGRGDVLKLVVGEGMILALLGVAVGLAAALPLGRLMSGLLYGVTSHDPVTFACIAGLLAAVTLVACYIPARRAMRVDPMVALRYE
jgi:predicted permease